MCTDISNACCSCANPLWRFAGFGCKGSRYKTLLQEIIVSAEKEFECLKPKKDDAKPKKDGDILSFCW
ncbi:Uncharacterised protein [uncultured Clostridium sp.]|jgi:hypothetical protein|nr:Uncharacterised protein [uncultured Clostridium sp.]